MKAYHVIGWSRNLVAENIGKSTTVSDGVVFSTREKAARYARGHLVQSYIEEFETSEDDPQVDYLEKAGII